MKYFISFLVVVVLGMIGIYYLNPYGTNSFDPRARILGVTFYTAPSNSMEPAIMRGSFIMVSTTAYSREAPERHDIVVFKPPHDERVWLKRVIANEGEELIIIDGKLFINDALVEQEFLNTESMISPYSLNTKKYSVPKSHFFVMGDNRDNSSDSRIWGVVPYSNLIGKVVYTNHDWPF